MLLLAIGLASVCSISANGCLGGALQPGLTLVVGIIALFTWPNMARLVRGQALTLREKEFVEGHARWAPAPIMFKELLPNLLAPIVVYATLLIPANILFEAALSFLGVGVPQSTPSWGGCCPTRRRVDLHRGLVDDAVPRPVPARHHPVVQPRG